MAGLRGQGRISYTDIDSPFITILRPFGCAAGRKSQSWAGP